MTVSSALDPNATPVNKVLQNTFTLLSLNIFSSAIVAVLGAKLGMPVMPWYVFLLGYFGVMYLVQKTENSILGIPMSFVFTSFLGLSLAPIINVLSSSSAGITLLAQALTGTALVFCSLAFYAMKQKVNFSPSFMNFLSVSVFSAFALSILNVAVFQASMLSLVLSVVFMFTSSAIILWQISRIVNGGERNYIRATITLYVQIYNMLLSLLRILGALSGND
ncbi:Bax inhibitor-1 family protein [Vibrio owensii]|uniref:Bax inhibitor-1 family protein n=1 Tax=Vibrio owensii TaxID=696485 RepID=UPI003CC622AD